MLEPIYYYDAYINSRNILYKTHRADLEHGDKIIRTYATGAKSIITINYGYGTSLPAQLLSPRPLKFILAFDYFGFLNRNGALPVHAGLTACVPMMIG